MDNMKRIFITVAFAVVFIGIISQASAFTSCVNTTWSQSDETIAGTRVNSLEQCPYGCNSATGECNRADRPTGVPFDMILILFVVALGSLIAAVKLKGFLFALISFVLFQTVAFAGYEIEYITSTGILNYGTNLLLVQVSQLFAFIALIIFIYGGFRTLKQIKSNEDYDGGGIE